MTTLSASRPVGFEEGGYVVRADPSSSIATLPYPDSSTRSVYRLTGRFVLPMFASLAAMGSPVVPGVRRVFSSAAISRSALVGEHWLLDVDAFYFTEESAAAAEVRALNALLHLPTSTGLELDLPE